MAQFIIGSPLRNLAREHESLRNVLWRLDYALVWSLHALLRALPIDLSSQAGHRLGRWIGALMKKKSGIFRENFAIAFPEKSAAELDALVAASWGQAGRVLAEYAHLPTIIRDTTRLHIEVCEEAAIFADPAKPAVFVTAHMSNWEVIGCAMSRLGIPSATLYSPPTNPLLDRLLMDSRTAMDCKLVARDNSARLLMKALKSGRSASMVMDRRVDDGKGVAFFGEEKLSTIVPAKLALKFDCDMIPVQTVRQKDASFKVIFYPPIRPASDEQDENTQALNMTEQAHQLFEQWITTSPQDWFCSKRLWPRGTLTQRQERNRGASINSHAA
ncbi:MAG: lysophospholipid acyltransferase family protein [Halioglobus sp.]